LKNGLKPTLDAEKRPADSNDVLSVETVQLVQGRGGVSRQDTKIGKVRKRGGMKRPCLLSKHLKHMSKEKVYIGVSKKGRAWTKKTKALERKSKGESW